MAARGSAEATAEATAATEERAEGGGAEGAGAAVAALTAQPGRGQLFAAVIDTFLEKLVAAGSYERFARCYRELHRLQPALTRGIHEQLVWQLQAAVRDEIQEVKDEGNLEALLGSLDGIVEEARGRPEPAWRPSGLPREDVRSALVPYLLKHRGYLRKALRDKEAASTELARAARASRDRIAELQRLIRERREAWQALGQEQQELVRTLTEPQ